MSKHSLVTVAAGLGLMAMSMGASAQLHTFDYSMMYGAPVTGGVKYVAFVPTMTRGADGSANVLMLDLFQPATGSASTWAYAVGDAVDNVAGGAGSSVTLTSGASTVTATLNGYANAAWADGGGVTHTGKFYHGDNAEIKLAFKQDATVSSQACEVKFSAVIGTNDQLAFANIQAQPVSLANWASATDHVTVSTGAASVSVTFDKNAWNDGSATLTAFAGSAVTMNGLAAGGATGGTQVQAMIAGRNKCVTAYNARKGSGSQVIGPGGPVSMGMVRIW